MGFRLFSILFIHISYYRKALDLKDGSKVNVIVRDNELVVTLASLSSMSAKVDLKQLMSEVSSQNKPNIDQSDQDIYGNEVW